MELVKWSICFKKMYFSIFMKGNAIENPLAD